MTSLNTRTVHLNQVFITTYNQMMCKLPRFKQMNGLGKEEQKRLHIHAYTQMHACVHMDTMK